MPEKLRRGEDHDQRVSDEPQYQSTGAKRNAIPPSMLIEALMAGLILIVILVGIPYYIYTSIFIGDEDVRETQDVQTTIQSETSNSIRSKTEYESGSGVMLKSMNFSSAELADTALAIRSSGHICEKAVQVEQLVQRGESLPIFRTRCSNDNLFQITILGNSVRVKPWTGALLGE